MQISNEVCNVCQVLCLAWGNNPLDFSKRSENLWTYSCNVSEGFCHLSMSMEVVCCLVATEPKLYYKHSLILFQPNVGGYELMVLLKEPCDLASANLYASLLVRAADLMNLIQQFIEQIEGL